MIFLLLFNKNEKVFMKCIERIMLIVMCVFVVHTAHSQIKLCGGIGVFNMFNPLPEAVNTGFNARPYMGLYVSGRTVVSDKVSVGANLGYYLNSYEKYGGHITEYVMPVLGMLEYRFGNDDFVPYIGGNLGLYRFGAFGNDETNAAGYFGFAPSAGFDYNLSRTFFLHGCMYYHYIMTHGFRTTAFGFNAGIGIKF
jgi:hypothetical protein